MIPLHERGRMGNEAHSRRASERAARLRGIVAAGEHIKRAAHAVGVSDRTARRYLAGAA